MKKICLILPLILALGSSAQQDNSGQNRENPEIKTLVGCSTKIGGYASTDIKLAKSFDDFGLMTGGKFGILLDHKLMIGFGGYDLAFTSMLDYVDPREGTSLGDTVYQYNLDIKYGGLMLEYMLFPYKLLHVTFPVLIGGGSVRLLKDDPSLDFDFKDFDDIEDVFGLGEADRSTFFVVEPGVNKELNVAKYFRLGFGASYKHIRGADLDNVSNADDELSNFSFNLTVKAGIF